MSKTSKTDEVLAKLFSAELSDEVRANLYKRALEFNDEPKLDCVKTPEELASLKRKMDLITLGYDPTLDDPFEGQSPEEARARYLLQSHGLLSDMARVAGIDLSKHPDWDALDKALEGEFPKDSIPD